MLQKMRDHLTGWVSIFLFIIIGLAFALWGVPNEFTSRNQVAQVNGEEIPIEEARRAYRAQLNQLRQFSDVTPEQEDVIRTQVLQGLVIDEILAQHTSDIGFHIGNEALVTNIRNMEAFQDQGQFSLDLFRSRLQLNGMSPEYFEAQLRRALQISQLRQAITATAFVTPQELERRTRLEREQRRAAWLRLEVPVKSQDITIDPAEIEAYYQDNQALYMRPESVAIEYVSLNLADLAADVTITDDELREYYEREIATGRFQQPEERRASHILVAVDGDTDDAAAAALASELLERLEAGEDFAALAGEFSDDPGSGPEGGDLGWAQRSAYVGAFADALFAMDSGELRGPVRTEFGYHIIRLDDQRGGVAQPFAEVADELRIELARIRAEDEFYDVSERMADLSFENPQTLEPIATEIGLEPVAVEGILRSGGPDVAADPQVVDAAFSERVLDQRENSDLIELSPENRIVLRVTAYQPAEQRPLDEVRDAIEVALRTIAARELAAERGAALVERARAGEPLAELATAAEAEFTPATTYRRTAGLPPQVRDDLFAAPKPQDDTPVVRGLSLPDGAYAVYALTEIIPGSADNLVEAEAVVNEEGVGDLTAYVSEIRDDASVTLRPELLE